MNPKPSACLGKGFHRNDACGRPFDKLRANGFRMAPATGCGGLGARVSQSWAVVGQPPPLPRGSFGPPFTPFDFPQGERPPWPRPSGYRLSPVRCGGSAATVGVGCRGGGSCLRGKTLRQAQGERNCEWPLRRVGGVGARVSQSWAVVGRPPPLWIPAFAGKTVGGVGEAVGVWVKPRERAMLGAAWVASDSVASAGYWGLVATMRSLT